MTVPQPIKAIVIHGNGGGTAGDIWLPWLERELIRLGLDVINKTFPDNVRARAQFWLPFIESLGADDHTILIGHSSGAVAAMRHAEAHRLLGSVLVGVCHTDLGDGGEKASGYYRAPWQWDRIRDNQEWIGVFNSSDDPHIPIAEARHVAAQLRCNYFEFDDRGHFVDQSTFPEVVDFVRKKLVYKRKRPGVRWDTRPFIQEAGSSDPAHLPGLKSRPPCWLVSVRRRVHPVHRRRPVRA